ncbi:MAG: glycerol-3-phosphate 1-O-acyltransferase PlsY [Fimbriimonadaceae bacterium]
MNWETANWPLLISLAVGAYVLGSIPFGKIVASLYGIDITKQGSGNIGATNVLRVLGKGPGIVVLVLDALKGFAPALVALLLFGSPFVALLIGAMALIGHCSSPFLGFRGGKGVATGLGVLIGAVPLLALIALVTFGLVFAASRIVSLSSLSAAVVLPVAAYFLGFGLDAAIMLTVLALLVIIRHRSNISRLLAGTEPKLDLKRKDRAGTS